MVSISGLKVGDKIKFPGEEIPKSIRKLWKLRLFTDIQIGTIVHMTYARVSSELATPAQMSSSLAQVHGCISIT